MADTIADAAVVRLAQEAVLGTAPGAGAWVQISPDVNGIQSWNPQQDTVERNTLNPYLSVEKGDVIKREAKPVIVHDPNKDLIDLIAPSAFRCVTKHVGNKGQSLYRPTAVTGTGYTVAALGDLSDNLLIFARGFKTAANNGLKLTAGASIAASIKCAGLTAEAAPPANATLDVVGVQASVAADFQLNASNHLTSTTTSFVTAGFQVGQWIYFPSAAEALAMGSANFAFAGAAAVGGFARITSVATNLCELERHTWTTGGADVAAGKTIRIFTSRLYRNYPVLDANFARASLHGELEQVGPGAGGGATYEYVKGCRVAKLSLAAPITSKITATLTMVGIDATDPLEVAGRIVGPSTAYAPQADALSDTQNDLKYVQIRDSAGLLLTSEVIEWNLSIDNRIDSKYAQGSINPTGHEEGKFAFQLDSLEAYYQTAESLRAVTANRDCSWFALTRNSQLGMLYDLPNLGLRNPQVTFQEGKLVRVRYNNCPAFRNKADNIVGSLTVFGYLP